MRFFILIQALLFALVPVIFGIVVFVKIGADQRQLNAKLDRIHAGQVQPETLTVMRKYFNTAKHGSTYCHILYRSRREPEINLLVSQSYYDAAKPGDKASGYYFPDGYIIPQSLPNPSGNIEFARWILLGSGLFMGIILLAFMLLRVTNSAGSVNTADLLEAIRNRANQSSEL